MARTGHRTKPLSDDLRCTLWHMRYVAGLSVEQIAALTGAAKRTVYHILSTYEHTGDILRAPKAQDGRWTGKLKADDLLFLEACIEDSSDAYLDELKLRLEEYAGVKVSVSTVWRTLRKLGFTLKKVSKVALERSEEKRMEYVYHVGSTYQAEQLVFVDESSFDRRTTYRGRAWALKGRRAERKMFYVRGKRYSILPALSLDGILFCDIVEGSYNTERFISFIEQLLDRMQPYPAPNSVVIMDNCRIHKDPQIRELIESRGMRLEFLPAYSPDFNPIEQAFSVMKASLRRLYPHFAQSNSTGTNPEDYLEVLLMLYNTVYAITPELAAAFFRHSGYI